MRIALLGPICSGKTTIAKYFEYNHNYIRLSFGSALKKYCSEIFNMDYKNRSLLQDFGKKTREIDPLVWVSHIEKEIIKNKTKNIVVDDVRYPNEYSMLQKYGFAFIKLEISRDFQIERLKKTYPDTYKEHLERLDHESELYINHFDGDKILIITKDNEIQLKEDIIKYFVS